MRTILTLGHSTHDIDAFLDLLRRHGVEALVDVRRFPRSRRFPHFDAGALAAAIEGAGMRYAHAPALGGRRRPSPDSPNLGWDSPAFRGYADHMATPGFAAALADLEGLAARRRIACMCAEGLWWRCHRRILSDALVVRGWEVLHVLPDGNVEPHVLTPFAVSRGPLVTYPPAQPTLDL